VTRLTATLDVSAVPEQPAGAGRYTVEVAKALVATDAIDLTLLTRRNDHLRWEALGARQSLAIVPDQRLGRLAFERWRMGRAVDRLDVAVHHAPHYTMPGLMRTPTVVTIHDVTFFERPEVHEAAKVRFFTNAIRRAASTAGALICVSSRTAERLALHVEVLVPIVVAPHGIDHGRFTETPPDGSSDDSTLESVGLRPGRQRIVSLGTLEPRKGIDTLLAAFELLSASDPDLELVIAGQRGWGTDEIDRLIRTSAHADRIHLLGYVPDEVVPALLRTAAVVAYPSVDEGFGLPALEALACGAPVVTTAGSVMEEICGTAPWFCDPSDAAHLAHAIGAALGADPAEAGRRRRLGVARAAGFTWEASASRHLEAYRLAESTT